MTYNSKFNYMKKLLLTIALALFCGATMAQNAIDLTFSRNNGAAGTDATVSVASTGDVDATGITSTIACNYNWKAFTANSTTFPNSNILCPDKNTKDMTGDAAGVITLTIAGVPDNYEFTAITLKSVALNGGGAFQGDNANAQHIDFILKQDDATVAQHNDVAIKVNSNGGESVTVNFVPSTPIKAADGTVTLKINIVNNYTAYGCFYGLFKVTIDTEVTTPELPEEPAEVSYLTQVTAGDLMAKTEATNIAIKNLSYTNNRWFVGNTGAAPYSAEEFTNDAIFIWEPVQAGVAGSYYLKKGNTYMQATSPKDFGTVDNAAVFTATNPTSQGSGSTNFNGDGDSNLYITGSTDANIVRFVKGSNWINVQNGAAGTPVYNTGTGGWTIHYVYEVAEVASFKANISSAGYATFYAPVEVAIPENVKAYYITEGSFNGEKVTLTQIENVIPANTAVILEGAEGEYTFNVSETNAAAVSGNLLKGTVINTNIIGDAYVLGVVEGETGLYKALMSTVALSSASGSVKVFLNNANKAYLPASAVPATANNAASFSFRFGEGTTGISEVKTENGEVKTIYDLTGRKVEAITAPGIYIVGGKKVLVK